MINFLFLWIVLGAFQGKPQAPTTSGPMIIADTPREASCLCGQIKVFGEGMEGFLIEEVTPDFERVVQSTRSGKNGYFKFSKTSPKELHYICVSNEPNFYTTCLKIKISKKVKETLIMLLFSAPELTPAKWQRRGCLRVLA